MKDWKEALGKLIAPECISDTAEALSVYGKHPKMGGGMGPIGVVKPQNADQVQALVKWANETGTPLVPVSSTGLRSTGSSTPEVPHAIMVDLSGMKKILNVNRQQRMAVIEPGVTYAELKSALDQAGLEISMPMRPKPGKSVVASILEMEPRLNALHQWNFIDPLRCTEVVWGDGNRMYTGEAGGSPPNLQQQWDAQKWQVSGTGPMMLDFYRLLTGAQGSMGIVTWASLKCEVKTTMSRMKFVGAASLDALEGFVYKVLHHRFSNELAVLNASALASLMSDSALEAEVLSRELPAFVALVGMVGRELLPEERVEQQDADIQEIAQQHGLVLKPSLAGLSGDAVRARMLAADANAYWKHMRMGASKELFFATTLDKSGAFIDKMEQLAKKYRIDPQDIGVYVQPQNMGTSMHVEFMIPYHPDNQAEAKKANELFEAASREFSSMGAFYYRPYGQWAQQQLNKDATSYDILKQLKDVFDPKHILNPGKLGI